MYRTDPVADKYAEYGVSPGVYPGFRTSLHNMKTFAVGEVDPELSPLRFLIFAFWLADAPISFALDTLCLPQDISQAMKKKKPLPEEERDG